MLLTQILISLIFSRLLHPVARKKKTQSVDVYFITFFVYIKFNLLMFILYQFFFFVYIFDDEMHVHLLLTHILFCALGGDS